MRPPRRGGQSQGEQDPHPRQQRRHVMGRAVRRVRHLTNVRLRECPLMPLSHLGKRHDSFPEKDGWDRLYALNVKSIFYGSCRSPISILPADLSGQLPSGSRLSWPRTLLTTTPAASSTYHQSLVSPRLLVVRRSREKATAFGAVCPVLHPFISRVLNSSQTTPAKQRVNSPFDMTTPVNNCVS